MFGDRRIPHPSTVLHFTLELTGAFDGALEPGMTLCVECLISCEGGNFSIKLEERVLITEAGVETLSRYAHDRLLAGAETAI